MDRIHSIYFPNLRLNDISLIMTQHAEGTLSHNVDHFFDPDTWTLTYVLSDPKTRDAVVIDPVWDYDPASSTLNTKSVTALISFLKSKELNVRWILETHAHADHVSGAQAVKRAYPHAQLGIGKHIQKVQAAFKQIYNLHTDFPTDGRQFDVLLDEGETYAAGSLNFKVLFTPGHTPACSAYLFGDSLFSGDAIFIPDYGTGRCDFPMGSAEDLYHSIHEKIYKLPDSTKIYVGHDYMPNGRELRFQSTVAEQKKNNIHLKQSTTKEDFIKFRKERDAKLSAPRLLLPSIQINIHGGNLLPAENNGVHYLKIPVRLD